MGVLGWRRAVLFSIVPSIFDIVAACIFIAAALEGWIAVIVFVTLGSYIPLTIYLTEWRTKYRRCAAICATSSPHTLLVLRLHSFWAYAVDQAKGQAGSSWWHAKNNLRCRDLNKFDNAKGARVTDALLNYETGGPSRKPALSCMCSELLRLSTWFSEPHLCELVMDPLEVGIPTLKRMSAMAQSSTSTTNSWSAATLQRPSTITSKLSTSALLCLVMAAQSHLHVQPP